MQLRNFLQGIATSVGVAAIPFPNIVNAAAVASSTAAKVITFHYGWACVHAQRNNGISADDICRVFKVSPREAFGLTQRRELRGVIGPVGLDGRSHPTRTWQPSEIKHPASVEKSTRNFTEQDWNVDRGTKAGAKFRARIAKVVTDRSCD